MIKRGIPVSPIMRCTCSQDNITFYLPIRSLISANTQDGTKIPPKEMMIMPGSKLQTSQGFIDDFIKIVGTCATCKVEHTAVLEVKGGLVYGIKENTVTPITQAPGSSGE